ncbi:MAG: hydantoinase B/oxoprolinase family protein, partial [Bacteroidetes bacterium]
QESSLEVPFSTPEAVLPAFRQRYRHLFGHYPEEGVPEVESLKLLAAAPRREAPGQTEGVRQGEGERVEGCPLIQWDELEPGQIVPGPCLLLNYTSSAYVEAGWELACRSGRDLVLRRVAEEAAPEREAPPAEAVELELFTRRFESIAEEMGAQLQRTAFSTNVKERLDFSCALLDPRAELLVNAPHIPVHLGSLGICARLVLQRFPLRPGDVILTNHPAFGGSHLPDLTLLSAVHTPQGELVGYVINRAHHAEIGGRRPGSMPPDARTLEEEGVVIPPFYLVQGGRVRWQELRRLLLEARYPTRALEANLADINAALAALRSGSEKLLQLVDRHGLGRVHHYMAALKESAAGALEQALEPYRGRELSAEERLDDGSPLRVRIHVGPEKVRFDFTGTAPRHPFNLNANLAIVNSVVIYVLRLLCRRPVPLNEGLMQRVELHLPEDSLLHPRFPEDPARCPAVVGGNTEVSQRLVDTLLKAFGLAACSQGTMNNFLFGNERYSYYETIGGGVGAGEGFHGRSAVHQHMTNTRITDPEELEFRFPVRLRAFSIRKGSGGAGKWRGGDGIVRELEFLEAMEFTLLTQHRVESPYGLQGGSPGKVGAQYLLTPDGRTRPLKGIEGGTVEPGARIRIETPGGGGYGLPEGGAEES